MLPHQPIELCNELCRCFQAPSHSVRASTAPCLVASVCKESLCWFCAGMPHSSCCRAPAELINHFQKVSQMDELGFRLCSLQNNLAWSLRLPVVMGGGWQPCCGHVPGPVTQHLLCQVPANISGRGRDLHWCCSAARTPEDCWT